MKLGFEILKGWKITKENLQRNKLENKFKISDFRKK